jgi:hypothetical protein
VLFFSRSVTIRVERRFAGSAEDPKFTDCMSEQDWLEYAEAFAAGD